MTITYLFSLLFFCSHFPPRDQPQVQCALQYFLLWCTICFAVIIALDM